MALKDLFFKPEKPALNAEYGVSGTSVYDGIVDDEYNSSLSGQEGVKIYDQMRRSDAQVYASLRALKLPIRAADWYIERAKGEDEGLSEEQALFIEKQLFGHLNWNKQIQNILTMLDFGFKYMEIVYSVDLDGRIFWKKWADRIQSAHNSWLTAEKKAGVTQNATTGVNLETGEPTTSKQTMSIPMNKLLLFTYQQEGGQLVRYFGFAPAYKHWFYKEQLYKISAISAERFGVGVPHIKLPDTTNATDLAKAEGNGKELAKQREKSFIATPANWGVEILSQGGDSKASAIEKLIAHHDHKIMMNVLAPFLDLGSGETGSFALSKDQSSFFVLGLEAIARDICDVVNAKIRDLILLNWPETKDFPKLKAENIGRIDFAEYSAALSTLSAMNGIVLTPEVVRFIHKTFNLPQIPEDYEAEQEMKPKEEKEEPEEATPDIEEEDKPEKPKKELSLAETAPSKAEKIFQRAINLEEDYLQTRYEEWGRADDTNGTRDSGLSFSANRQSKNRGDWRRYGHFKDGKQRFAERD
jgi:hypothetical protein